MSKPSVEDSSSLLPSRMVRSKALTVDAYLAEAPEERREALTRLRALCLEELTGFKEAVMYGMPAYLRNDMAEIAFASQKHYMSLYIMRTDVRDAHAERLIGQDMGKGCLRFRKPSRIDFDLVGSILRDTAAASGPVC